MLSTDEAWEKFGRQAPYFGVLADERFAADRIHENREEFFAAQGTPQQQANGLSGVAASFASNHTPNNPSTPTSTHAGLNTGTPGPHYGHSMAGGSMGTAGFGNFQYGK